MGLVLAACGPSPISTSAPGAVVTNAQVATSLASDPTLALIPTAESSTTVLFQLEPAGSEARFILDEVLRGQPNTVVGTTDRVSG